MNKFLKKLVYVFFNMSFALHSHVLKFDRQISIENKFVKYDFNDINLNIDNYINNKGVQNHKDYLQFLEAKANIVKNLDKKNQTYLGWIVPEILCLQNPQNTYTKKPAIYFVIASQVDEETFQVENILRGALQNVTFKERNIPLDDSMLLITDIKEYVHKLGYNKTQFINLENTQNARWYLEFAWNS